MVGDLLETESERKTRELRESIARVIDLEERIKSLTIRHQGEVVDLLLGIVEGNVDPFQRLVKEKVLKGKKPDYISDFGDAVSYIASESLHFKNPKFTGVTDGMFNVSGQATYSVNFFLKTGNSVSLYRHQKQAEINASVNPYLLMRPMGYDVIFLVVKALLDVPEESTVYVKKQFVGNRQVENAFYAEVAVVDKDSVTAYVIKNCILDAVQIQLLQNPESYRSYSGPKIPLPNGEDLSGKIREGLRSSLSQEDKDAKLKAMFEAALAPALTVPLSSLAPVYTRNSLH